MFFSSFSAYAFTPPIIFTYTYDAFSRLPLIFFSFWWWRDDDMMIIILTLPPPIICCQRRYYEPRHAAFTIFIYRHLRHWSAFFISDISEVFFFSSHYYQERFSFRRERFCLILLFMILLFLLSRERLFMLPPFRSYAFFFLFTMFIMMTGFLHISCYYFLFLLLHWHIHINIVNISIFSEYLIEPYRMQTFHLEWHLLNDNIIN